MRRNTIKPLAVHDHGENMQAAFAHALTLATGGWTIRTRRVGGRWQISVYNYGVSEK